MKMTYETGLLGEDMAAVWLEEHYGMRLQESRYRNKAGEIDLIMLDKDYIVFVEVKTRISGRPGCGLESVNRRKQQRIVRAATLYLMQHKMLNHAIRFDVIEVRDDEFLYIPNAFQPGGMFYR